MIEEKYYVFREWHSFDCGGMEVFEFEDQDKLKAWIKKEYPKPEDIKEGVLYIIKGEKVEIHIEETEIIKKIKLR